jgi:hypothetical protein
MFFRPTYPNIFAFEAGNRTNFFFWGGGLNDWMQNEIYLVDHSFRKTEIFMKILSPKAHNSVKYWSMTMKLKLDL